MKMELNVIYEDGTEIEVKAGQREMAAFEQKFQCSTTRVKDTMSMTFMRYCAFEALRRSRQLPKVERGKKEYTATWEEWDDLVDEVVDVDEEEGEADPTPEGQQLEG